MASSKDKWVRRFFIAEIGCHRDGFTIYKVTSLIFLKKSPEITSKVSVWKRYNDFRKLHKSLEALNKYLSIKEPFPSFAKRNYFRRFEKEVVNERRKCALRLLEFIAKHSALYTSDVFIQFFETSLDPDDNTHNVDHSITSSDDDCNSNNKNNDEKCNKHQNAIDSSFDADSSIAENHVNSNHEMTSPASIKSDNITLNFNVKPQDLNDAKNKNEQCGQNQLNNFVTLNHTTLSQTDNSDYIIVAAAHMSAGHQHELLGEYEEAYIQYKYSITHLQLGAEIDPDPIQQMKVLEKIKKHVSRIDEFYEKNLYHNSSILSKPTTELENYKVLKIIGRVMVVKDTRHIDLKRVIKTIEKCIGDKEGIFHYILRKKVPFMVNLHAYVQTESTVFFIVEYASGGLLWNFIKSNYEYKEITSDSFNKSQPDSIVLNSQLMNTNNKPKNYHFSNKNNDFPINFVDIPRKLDGEFDACSDISTNKLMAQSQELLKSVDETLKKSNSMINITETKVFKSNNTNDMLRVSNTTQIKNNELSETSLPSNLINHSSNDTINISNTLDTYDSFDESMRSTESAEISQYHGEPVNITSGTFNTYFQPESSEINLIKMNQKRWQIPESVCKQWTAQLLLAIEAIHKQNVIISNLRPDDLLIDENNHFVLSYVIPRQFNEFKSLQIPYAAPELFLYLPHISANEAADIWSFGIILYELLTGISFQIQNPGLFNSHSFISIPEDLTEAAKHLLVNILKFKPNDRLTVYQIKEHPFFRDIDWKKLLNP